MVRKQWHGFIGTFITPSYTELQVKVESSWESQAYSDGLYHQTSYHGTGQVRTEVELRVGSPASLSSLDSVEQQDKTPLGLDEEQLRAALGGGPRVTLQTAEDVL
ncbi:hypothetical protein NDU88_003991 [Pleurodeles waltl]|uniref:Uncharacterized protein n=1 Tax=Pleurodeles waltl TaxID=8319 RepID=A0AAV7SHH4_PLEWA|nr:hypothetical protein NDU88_003991 [Pleurodeles waltl]